MKAIYLTIIDLLQNPDFSAFPNHAELLASIQKIRWIDMDKGQLEYYETRPAGAFPCALIKIELSRTESIGQNIQRCTALATIRLAFDYIGQTSALTPTQIRNQSLEYFDIVEAIYIALQGKALQGSGQNGRLSRENAREEFRPDGLKVINIPFQTILIDKSANQ